MTGELTLLFLVFVASFTGTATMNLMRGMNQGPMRLYVGSLHFNITDDMLRGIFEPFGKIDKINLVMDENNRSKGFGFVTVSYPYFLSRTIISLYDNLRTR